LCVHGDTPNAAEIALAVRAALASEGIALHPVSHSEG
jgi:lactam utilization protein B